MSRRAILLAALAIGCAGAPVRPATLLPSAEPRTPSAPVGGDGPGASPCPATATRADAAAAGAAAAEAAPTGAGAAPPEAPAAGDAVEAEEGAREAAAIRARVLAAARRLLGTRPRLDCSGYVLSALRAAGVTVELRPARARSEALYRASRPVTQPRPGDLVFFHDTRSDRGGRRRGGIGRVTHVALVESVNGTALTLLHRGSRRVDRIRMDLSRPSDRAANDPVRLRRRHDRPGVRTLSGELFTAFGALLTDDVTHELQARRGPDTPERHPATR